MSFVFSTPHYEGWLIQLLPVYCRAILQHLVRGSQTETGSPVNGFKGRISKFSINPAFSVFIPTGKAVDPVGGGNWEQSGVEPDIRTNVSNAFNIAFEKAAFAARSARSSIYDKIVDHYWDLVTEVQKFTMSDERQSDQLFNMLDNLVSKKLLDEWTINRLGYFYMRLENFVATDFIYSTMK